MERMGASVNDWSAIPVTTALWDIPHEPTRCKKGEQPRLGQVVRINPLTNQAKNHVQAHGDQGIIVACKGKVKRDELVTGPVCLWFIDGEALWSEFEGTIHFELI